MFVEVLFHTSGLISRVCLCQLLVLIHQSRTRQQQGLISALEKGGGDTELMSYVAK